MAEPFFGYSSSSSVFKVGCKSYSLGLGNGLSSFFLGGKIYYYLGIRVSCFFCWVEFFSLIYFKKSS